MKYIAILSILAAMLVGCAVAPAGYGDYRDGYDHGSNRSESKYRGRDYNQGAGNDRDYRDRGEPDNQGDLFLYHSSS